jgi:hypothetical protein
MRLVDYLARAHAQTLSCSVTISRNDMTFQLQLHCLLRVGLTQEYLEAFDKLFLPIAHEFKPNLILVSSGMLFLEFTVTPSSLDWFSPSTCVLVLHCECSMSVIHVGFDAAAGDRIGGFKVRIARTRSILCVCLSAIGQGAHDIYRGGLGGRGEVG